jgi:integrase
LAKINFTAGRISDFKCPPDKLESTLWDATTKGLGLRATAKSKSYIFLSTLKDGRKVRITIGDPSHYGIDDARTKATELQKSINDGLDPREVKAEKIASSVTKREQAKARQAPALDAWGEYALAKSSQWSERYKRTHEQMSRAGGEKITRGKRSGMGDTKEQGALRPILELPLKAITREQVEHLIVERLQTKPETARLALALLSSFLHWCIDYSEPVMQSDGTITHRYPYKDQINPDACQRMKQKLAKPKARDDCLQREQLKLWFEYVRRIENPTHAAYLQCLLLTGARRNELAALRWEDLDFQWQSLIIRDKVEGRRTIPLTPYVASLLQELKRINETPPNVTQIKRLQTKGEKWQPSPWVFSSASAKDGRIQEPRINHNKALTAAGLPDLSIHGLRRSFGTLCEWVEMPAGISAQIMGHSPSAIAEKHYRRRPLDLLRMWHTKIEGWILEQAGIEQPSSEVGKLKIVATS